MGDQQVHESQIPLDFLPKNQEPMDPFFGTFLGALRKAIEPSSSEFGLGLTLFSLAVTTNARLIIEIGRFKGFSTFCLASALKFLEIGWQEPARHRIRPDVDYATFEAPSERALVSIDCFPMPEAEQLLETHGLTRYVKLVNGMSNEVTMQGQVDMIFIDGDHHYEGCKDDVNRYAVNHLRPGGYFILHDYFGWYDEAGRNQSPIKQVAEETRQLGIFEDILIDTGYMSFVIFRKKSLQVGR